MKIANLLKSRTFWTVIALFIINGVSGIRDFFPESLLPLVDGILGLATIYFAKISPKQTI